MNSRCQASSSCARIARQGLQLEIEKDVDIERAGLVLLVELEVSRFVQGAVENSLADQELRPFKVAVAGDQGVVEVEEDKIHGLLSAGQLQWEVCRTSRSSGRVIGRLCSSE
jgi:hypothetical protein